MGHTVLIATHAAAGLVAFTVGCLALTRRSYFTVYFCSLVLLMVFLAAAVAVDWAGLDTASQTVFATLTALGGYMIWRAVQARRLQQATSPSSAPAASTTSGSASSPCSTDSLSSSRSTSAHRHGSPS